MKSAMRFDAAVFDLDGTLVDNMRFHAKAWLEVSDRLGRPGLVSVNQRIGWRRRMSAQ